MAVVGALAGSLVASMIATPALAQTKDDTRQKLEESQRKLQARREAEKGLAADVDKIQVDRERVNQSLVEMARAIQQGEGRLTGIEERQGALETQEKFLRGSLTERHSSIVRLLGAMQRMGRNPPPVMITRRADALVMVRSAMMLAAAFPQVRTQALKLAADLNELARVIGETKSEAEKLRAETKRLAEQRTRLAGLLEEKKQSLSERQTALDQVRREAAEISRSVTDLNDLITRLDKVVASQADKELDRAGSHPGTGQAEEKQAMLAPPLKPSLAPGRVGPSGLEDKAADGTAPAFELTPSGRRLAGVNPGRIKPAMPFDLAKGKLPLPAQGKRIIGFKDKAQTSRSNGIVIETRSGARVTSPADGWIVYAGVFRTYGQILIINVGGGYHILLAGLSQIDVQLGQFVLAGEPVGVMAGDAREAKGKPSGNAPVLYVEFRKDGHSIDPAPWWAADGT